MAAAQLNRTRRALLGAAVALPLVGGPPSADKGRGIPDQVRGDERWRKALAAYRAAEAELRGFEAFCSGRPFEEQDALEARYGELGYVMYDALRALLRVPAPDVRALAAKIELIVEHEVGTLTGGEACMAALRRDARRLAGA